VGEKAFRVSAGSFFQVNRYLVKELVQTVVGDFHGKIALDLFAVSGYLPVIFPSVSTRFLPWSPRPPPPPIFKLTPSRTLSLC